MTNTQTRRFAVVHIGLEGRVALCEVLGEVIEAGSWREARTHVDSGALADRPGYGFEARDGRA